MKENKQKLEWSPDPKVLKTRLYLTLSLTSDMQHSRQGRDRQCVDRKTRQGQIEFVPQRNSFRDQFAAI
jgi:hypothetical protein